MSDAKERLNHLVELAGQTAIDKQRALAFELCDLLVAWPSRYPPAMREPFEALLEKVLLRLESTTRRMIAQRLGAHDGTGPGLLNEFYFDAPAETRQRILKRNAESGAESPPQGTVDEAVLIDAARRTRGADFAAAFAHCLRMPVETAQRILDDSAGQALAVACKGAQLRRATFSALALLTTAERQENPTQRYARLAQFDDIPNAGAQGLLAFWRRRMKPAVKPDARAA